MLFKKFFKNFKRKYPYAPIAYLGRKTVERTLDANIRKLKKVEKEIANEADGKTEDTNLALDKNEALEKSQVQAKPKAKTKAKTKAKAKVEAKAKEPAKTKAKAKKLKETK